MLRLCGQLSKNAVHSQFSQGCCSVFSRPSELALSRKPCKTGLHENTSPFSAFLELRNSLGLQAGEVFFFKVGAKLGRTPGACTMMVDDKFRVTGLVSSWQNQTTPIRLCWYHDADHSTFFVNSGFDPEFVEHVHMNVWHHWRTANHEPWLKVKD